MSATVKTILRGKGTIPRFFLIFFVIIYSSLLFFIGCSSSREVSQRDLRRWIEEHPDFLMRDGQFAQINEIEILRRQTDTDQNTDLVWITVYATLGNTDFILSYYLHFGRYNNEWHLREFEPYLGFTGSWEQSFLDEDEILSVAREAFLEIEALDGLSIENLSISYSVEETLSASLEFLQLEFDLTAYDDIALFEMVLGLGFISTSQGWVHETESVISRQATPLQAIDRQHVDIVIENLPYDQINFVSRETDLDSHSDTLVYTARNSVGGLDRLMEIRVSPFFSTQSGRWEVSNSHLTLKVVGEWLAGEDVDVPLAERGNPPTWLQNVTSIGMNRFRTSSNNEDNFRNHYICVLSLNTAYIIAGVHHPDDHTQSRRGTFQTLLDGRYSRLRGTLFISYGTWETYYTRVWFEADGVVLEEFTHSMTNTTAPIPINIDLTGVNDFQIVVRREIGGGFSRRFTSPTIYFGNFRFYP